MRKIIAALQVSLDGFIEGPNGELDWVETWEDLFDPLPRVDTRILGRGVYPGYERYWRAILANPEGVLPFTGRVASKGEVDATRLRRFASAEPGVRLRFHTLQGTRHVVDVDASRRGARCAGSRT